MTSSKPLTDRVRAALAHTPRVAERKMFGGITFMVDGKMCARRSSRLRERAGLLGESVP